MLKLVIQIYRDEGAGSIYPFGRLERYDTFLGAIDVLDSL